MGVVDNTGKESKTVEIMLEEKNESLSERFQRAVSVVESSPAQAVAMLTDLQLQVANLSLISSNEDISEMSTGSLTFLALEHYLAMALMHLPTGPSEMVDRRNNLQRACDLWSAFLQCLERHELLSPQEKAQYDDLLELSSNSDLSSTTTSSTSSSMRMPPPLVNREAKIARFRAKEAAEKERQRLESLIARRSRLGLAQEEEIDGHDEDSLSRLLATTTLEICKAEALEEFASALRELPMIAMMVKSQEERQGQDRHQGKSSQQQQQQQQQPQKPLQLTHITQDAGTGQLLVRREEVQSKIFQRGWNQPTMSLEELADREVADAMAREERQQQSEASQSNAPRRYEQLVKDGMEDDLKLVDASAALDREWDDFKDQNPRGSGNKRGDVGDRNF